MCLVMHHFRHKTGAEVPTFLSKATRNLPHLKESKSLPGTESAAVMVKSFSVSNLNHPWMEEPMHRFKF